MQSNAVVLVSPDEAFAAASGSSRVLFATVGLPASGKSTWARQLVDAFPLVVRRVNRDDLRAMLDNGAHGPGSEKVVVRARDALVGAVLSSGGSVVVDDTNLTAWHVESLGTLADRHRARLVVVSFLDVPIEVCIERDAARSAPVGRAVIESMAAKMVSSSGVARVCR